MHLQFVTKSGVELCGIDQSMIKSYVILVRSHVVLCLDVKMVFCKEKARNTINFTVAHTKQCGAYCTSCFVCCTVK